MRKIGLVTSVAAVVGWSAIAAAQSLSPSSAAVAQHPSPAQVANTGIEESDHWFASGFLGSNFGSGGSTSLTNTTTGQTINGFSSGNNLSVNFGGELGYVFGGWIGAELMANWAPNFELNDALVSRSPSVSAYMANGLFLVPTRGEHRFSPFVSGGVGAIHLATSVFTVPPGATSVDITNLPTENVGGTEFGWDIGGGLFAFHGPWGLRADVRYYKATTGNNTSDITLNGLFLQRDLSGLSFWNANFGVAFRW